ncbi:hypothetical protein CHCC20331_1598 [Bacillus paralicheniformis]|nr:hypothetical protein CHCC20331_1598 [Bacillus paralicheniformis]
MRSQSQKRSYPEKWLPCIFGLPVFMAAGRQTVKQDRKSQ